MLTDTQITKLYIPAYNYQRLHFVLEVFKLFRMNLYEGDGRITRWLIVPSLWFPCDRGHHQSAQGQVVFPRRMNESQAGRQKRPLGLPLYENPELSLSLVWKGLCLPWKNTFHQQRNVLFQRCFAAPPRHLPNGQLFGTPVNLIDRWTFLFSLLFLDRFV